jgi:hypothetical protein
VNFKLDCKPKELLQEVFELRLSGVFCTITIELRTFVSLHSIERIFNVLKQVRNYNRSSTGQDHLNGFETLTINYDVARKLEFSSLSNTFQSEGYKGIC